MSSRTLAPLQKYRQDLESGGFSHDASQENAIIHLQNLYERLVAAEARDRAEMSEKTSLLGRLKKRFGHKPEQIEPERGLYFWGGVGRGKTYLMDTFYESLPFDRKLRVHFHRFMQRVHKDLAELKSTENPLEIVADNFARDARVICFDEFFVSDIGDAMILATLLKALFSRGVTLVCTSNIVPDGLYKDGLQRARFLPAIALVNQHTLVVNVDGGVDYRLRTLEQAELYHSPLDAEAETSLAASYKALAMDCGTHGVSLSVNGRHLQARMRCDDVVWFEFKELCDGPRSQNDYIELAREFHAILISNVPVFNIAIEDQARRFINLVDEFYDRRVKLILSAAAPIYELYQGQRLRFEFDRTESRLLEMQSKDYLSAEHKA